MTKVGIDVRGVPANLLHAVGIDARDRDMSIHDAVVEKLSAHYGFEFEPSGYPYSGTDGSDHWIIRVSPQLREMIRANAKATGGTMTGVVLSALAAAYGISGVSTRKRAPRAFPSATRAEIRRRHREGESVRALSREYGVQRDTIARALRD